MKLPKTKITNETQTEIFISVGLPVVAYLYFDYRAAVTAFVITRIFMGYLKAKE